MPAENKAEQSNVTIFVIITAGKFLVPNRAAFYSMPGTFTRQTCARKHDTYSNLSKFLVQDSLTCVIPINK